ncbi:hypothetical protein [Haladaptatus sp. CMAA 1911]|uniref:hypothetical protein n=1 Tax=unclassified Haladaptatus TaxID=2622732 RepID=UPI003754639E
MNWSKLTDRWDVALVVAVAAVQLVFVGYGLLGGDGTAEFGAHLAFAALWVVFGVVAFREHGTTRLSLLTVALLVGGGALDGYVLLATNPVVGDGIAGIFEGTGILLYAAQLRITHSESFQRA